MSKKHDSSFGYFRWLLLLVLAGIGWFIVENGPDILRAGGVDLHQIMKSIPMPNLATFPPVAQKT